MDQIFNFLQWDSLVMYFLLSQFPIIFLLIIFSYHTCRLFEKYKFENRLILIGWIVNFIYMIVIAIRLHIKEDSTLLYYEIKIIEKILEFSYMSCFLIAGTRYIKFYLTNKITRKSTNYIEQIKQGFKTKGYIFLGLMFILYFSFLCFVFFNKSKDDIISYVAVIPFSIFCVYSLFTLSMFFKFLYSEIKTHVKEKSAKNFLFIGTLIYASVQLFIILTPFYENFSNNLACFISLIGKLLILYGLQRYFVFYTEISDINSRYLERLQDTLGITFHELVSPLTTIEEHVNNLTVKGQDIKELENEVSKAVAIFTAQKNIYEIILKKQDAHEENITIEDLANENEASPEKINALIETALRFLKSDIKKNKITIKKFFSGNLIYNCKAYELIKVFRNLIKNSIDAVDKNGSGEIFIYTYKKKNIPAKSEELFIDIIDNGVGITEKNMPDIYNNGFTTKTIKKETSGYGLFISKEIVESYNGIIKHSSKLDPKTKNEIISKYGEKWSTFAQVILKND